jgi:hypothetical protein
MTTYGERNPGSPQVEDDKSFVFRLDVSNDRGKSWNEGQVEMTFRRSQ